MRSSIFSSNWSATTAIAVLLTALVGYMLALEIAARVVVPKISEHIPRETADYRHMLDLEPLDGARPTVLLIGNSLLLDGVVRQTIVERMSPIASVALFPIQGTTYNDWYFGMRRFFAEGARPAVVVLCINARQMLSTATNGEQFAHSMMQLRDYPAVVRASELDTMVASNYLLAHWSAWLARRVNVRIGLTERLLPRSTELASRFSVRTDTPLLADEDTKHELLQRLRDFRKLAEDNGARFVWLVVPTTNTTDPAPLIQAAAQAEGVQVVIPFVPGEMPTSSYSDGFHLNRVGAASFTDRVALQLSRLIEN